jgi:hypothetical protein
MSSGVPVELWLKGHCHDSIPKHSNKVQSLGSSSTEIVEAVVPLWEESSSSREQIEYQMSFLKGAMQRVLSQWKQQGSREQTRLAIELEDAIQEWVSMSKWENAISVELDKKEFPSLERNLKALFEDVFFEKPTFASKKVGSHGVFDEEDELNQLLKKLDHLEMKRLKLEHEGLMGAKNLCFTCKLRKDGTLAISMTDSVSGEDWAHFWSDVIH